MSNTVSERKKSVSGSAKLRRFSSKRSRRGSSKSEKSEQSLENSSSKDISASLEGGSAQIAKPINYREELTFLFFKSIIEEKTIETRELLYEETEASTQTSKNFIQNTVSKDFKDVKEKDLLNYSVVSVNTSKLILEESKSSNHPSSDLSRKESSSIYKSATGISKKAKSSKQSNLSLNNSNDSRRSSRQGTILSAEIGLEWILKIDDNYEKIIFKNGNRYEGQTSKGFMHGEGIFYWADGTVYEGYFKDGYPHGKGQMILPDLSIYEGEFFRGFFHGQGAFRITTTPVIYNGFWKHGMKHGVGWLLWEPKNWHDGEWFADQKHGFGYRRYKDGVRYKGMWARNMKNGEGSIIWSNNDYYVGEWMDDRPHGYGEYTWNLYFNKSLIFPYYNWYKGSWVEGERTGAGVMDFGANSGSKLAGIWVNNLKHGPGVMICGNGQTLQRNPLFENDKPVHMHSEKDSEQEEEEEEEDKSKPSNSTLSLNFDSEPSTATYVASEEKVIFEKGSYRQILKEINSKVAMRTFDDDILTHITKSGVNISETEFVKLDNEEMPYSKNWCPLNIPIHTVAEEVDLNYYIDMIINYFYECSQKNLLEHEFEYISTAVDIKLARKLVLKTSSHQAHNIDDGREQLKASEERLLRHLITAYMPQLTDLYNQYATFTKNEEVPFKATLIRLFLWQLLRDIGLPHQGITLVETDLFLANNPSSCVESDHYPFEPIYLWQFLQSLIGCCWLLFLQTKEEKFDCYTNGIIAQMFRQFLEYTVFPNAGKFEGSALTDYKDLLPIKPVYKMYLNIGEPHTVRDFLYQTCAKKGKNPPCYAAIKDDTKLRKQNGNNAVMLGHKIMFLEVNEYITPRPVIEEKNTDLFSVSLYTFRSLGKRKIVYCMAKVCPKIFTDDGSVDMEYKLTFLEFYEIVLQCTYEKVERKRRIEEKCKQKEFMLLMKESETEQEKDKGKKKKQKK